MDSLQVGDHYRVDVYYHDGLGSRWYVLKLLKPLDEEFSFWETVVIDSSFNRYYGERWELALYQYKCTKLSPKEVTQLYLEN